jgi:hypothetical protein
MKGDYLNLRSWYVVPGTPVHRPDLAEQIVYGTIARSQIDL